MKFSAILAILIAGGFLLLTTTINRAAAVSACKGLCKGELKCYETKLKGEEHTQEKCCCGKKCLVRIDPKTNVITSRGCPMEKADNPKLGCTPYGEYIQCVCDRSWCNKNSASTLFSGSIIVVMTTAALCLTIWPTNNIR